MSESERRGDGIKRTVSHFRQKAFQRPNQLACPAGSSNLILTLELSLNSYKNEKCKEITLLGGISPTLMIKATSLNLRKAAKPQWKEGSERRVFGRAGEGFSGVW